MERVGNWSERKRSWGGWETEASGKDRGAGGKLERAEKIVERVGNWSERKRSWGGWETEASGKDRGAGGKLERAEKVVGRVASWSERTRGWFVSEYSTEISFPPQDDTSEQLNQEKETVNRLSKKLEKKVRHHLCVPQTIINLFCLRSKG